MTRSAAALVVVAACGASPPPPAPRPTTASGTIALLEDVADRACACTDSDCARGLALDLETTLAGLPTFLDDPAFARGDAAIQRGLTCLWTHEVVGYAYGEITREANVEIERQTCACDDHACLTDVTKRTGVRVLHLHGVPKSEVLIESLGEINKRSHACSVALIDRVPVIQEAVSLRDRACACARNDVACGAEVGAALQDWTKRHQTTTVGGAESVRLKEIAREVGECLGNTGWSFPR